MIEHFTGALVYGGADKSTGGVGAPGLSAQYDSIRALVEAVAGVEIIELPATSNGRPIRVDLTYGFVGADGNVANESVYVVRHADLDGKRSIVLERVATIAWTCGTVAIANGRANHKWPKAVAVTADGVLLARTGREISEVGAVSPVFASIFDVGPAIAVARYAQKPISGGVTSFAGMHAIWK